MIRKQFVLTAVIVAMGAVPGVTGAVTNPTEKALHARSDALNRHYRLGAYARRAETSKPDWLRALDARSDALNRAYGLGKYAAATLTEHSSDWLRALSARSAALNQHYRLGTYAQTTATPTRSANRAIPVASTRTTAGRFGWADASIGAVTGVTVAIAVGWMLVTLVGKRRKAAV